MSLTHPSASDAPRSAPRHTRRAPIAASRNSRLGLATGIAVVAALTLSACGSAGASPSSSSSATSSTGDAIDVVASTNVWGDIVRTIGGDQVSVTSIMSDPEADPHSFEVSGQNQLAVSRAKLIVVNGGGYDDFMTTMISALGDKAKDVPVVDAVTASGHAVPAGTELNEHVFYDIPGSLKVAQAVSTALQQLDPSAAGAIQSRYDAFAHSVNALVGSFDSIKSAVAGTSVVITEPVPVYLLDSLGIVDKTPAEFSKAIEEGVDVPPLVAAETLKLITDKQVKALVYNEQATGPQTVQLQDAATQNGVAVVPVTETLPAGKDYLSWMTDNVNALRAALT